MYRCFIVSGLSLLLLSCGAGAGSSDQFAKIKDRIRKDYPSVRSVSTQVLAAWLADTNAVSPILLDVREAAEFEVSHLARAYCTRDLASALKVLREQGRERPVVAYCSVGYRSARLVAGLAGAGVTNAYNLEGSIFQWANEGRPLVREGRPEATVHPYDAKWGQLLNRDRWPEDW